MKTLYLDCAMGAAGDMLAGALLELMPDPAAALAELNAFGIPGVAYVRETLSKCGLAATHLSVMVAGHEESSSSAQATEDKAHHHHEHRTLADVLHIIGHLKLEPSVREDVKSVYESLAAAESRAHGKAVGEIHFHEVGALDAIADIAAFCHLLRRLAPDEVVASPIHVGSGTVQCAHGVLPVPAPATAFLLEGVSTYSDGVIVGELCTPTGAALIKRFATSFGPQPLMTVRKVGHGAGRKDFLRANVVRAMLGECTADESGDGEIFELNFNVDDMTGEELAFASERIFAAGARDVSFAPVVMKKGRPGQRVSVMCAAETRGEVVKAIFAHTSTLGVRETYCRRYTLDRMIETVALSDGSTVRRKVASGYGVRRAKWEADDLAAFARTKGIPLADAKLLLASRLM
jgi:hypothetical protein